VSLPPLTVRPVVHTAYLPEWLALFRALGAATLSADPMWTELQLHRGRVTLTALNRDATEGEVALGFETPDLKAYAAAVIPADGMVVEPFITEDYESLRAVGRDGMELLIDEAPQVLRPAEVAGTSIRGVWVTPEVGRAAEDLESLGLRRRLTQVNGRTIDLRAVEGDVLVHTSDGGPVEADVAVDVADVEAAHKALIAADIAHDVIDETHGRTLQVALPGDRDARLWIAQEDDDPVGVIKH
jgi:hypothetical protein